MGGYAYHRFSALHHTHTHTHTHTSRPGKGRNGPRALHRYAFVLVQVTNRGPLLVRYVCLRRSASQNKIIMHFVVSLAWGLLLRTPCSVHTHRADVKMSNTEWTPKDVSHQPKAACDGALIGGPCIVLVRPWLGVNVGAVARAMANFGLTELVLVAPNADHLSDDALARASGAEAVLRRARVCATIEEAVADVNTVFATSARVRGFSARFMSAPMAAKEMATTAGRGQRSALMFGTERDGLSNDDLELVDVLVQIPANPSFSSLNLAQAVNLMGSDVYRAFQELEAHGIGGEAKAAECSDGGIPMSDGLFNHPKDPPTTKEEQHAISERWEAALQEVGYDDQRKIKRLRRMLVRSQPTRKELGALYGVLAALTDGKRETRKSSSDTFTAEPTAVEQCPVCRDPNTQPFLRVSDKDYWRCGVCQSTFLTAQDYLTTEEASARYALHENNPNDAGYRKFLSKLVDPLLNRLAPGSAGLDFGCGPLFGDNEAPAMASMLREAGHSVALFDPTFAPDLEPLSGTYDFITASEVVEHLHCPADEFDRLGELLRPGGLLAVMTGFQSDDAEFGNWHYRRDPTHVVFYREETLRLVAERRGWTCEIPSKDVAFMRKPL